MGDDFNIVQNFFMASVNCVVGNERHISFWNKKWLGNEMLVWVFPNLYSVSFNHNAVIGDTGVWEDRHWCWNLTWVCALDGEEAVDVASFGQILHEINLCQSAKDGWRWIGNN